MRKMKQTVLMSNPIHIVDPCKVQLQPFEGQPRKYRKQIRFPRLAVYKSRIPNAGLGLFLCENVKKGDTIAKYPRKIVSEAAAKKLKKKVFDCHFFFVLWPAFELS